MNMLILKPLPEDRGVKAFKQHISTRDKRVSCIHLHCNPSIASLSKQEGGGSIHPHKTTSCRNNYLQCGSFPTHRQQIRQSHPQNGARKTMGRRHENRLPGFKSQSGIIHIRTIMKNNITIISRSKPKKVKTIVHQKNFSLLLWRLKRTIFF